MGIRDTAKADVRHNLVPQFLVGAAHFAREASTLEQDNATADDDLRFRHRAFVIGAVMQSVASIEAQVAEVTMHGPGSELGSDKIDKEAKAFLEPLADFIDSISGVMFRVDTILHLVKKPLIDRDQHLWQHANLLVKLRNELVHYKSKWGEDMEGEKLFRSLEQLRLPSPPWVQPSPHTNFFPHQCLSAARAKWAVETAVAVLDMFAAHLNVKSPIERHRERLKV